MSKSRDYLKRINFERMPYAFTGIDGANASVEQVRGKRTVDGAPVVVGAIPPGCLGRKASVWRTTYGASLDSFLTIYDGSKIVDGTTAVLSNFGGVYRSALHTTENANTVEKVDGKQQIDFIVSEDDVQSARSNATYTDIDKVRGLCIRAPMMMAGWGRTITMRPTDPDPQDPRENDNEHKMDRSTWPLGPVDLRWDSRRQSWRAYNDMIADDYSENLGTFVFGTNPDTTCGFPFQRSKLEDILTVRRTFPTDVASNIENAKSNDTAVTAETMLNFDGRICSGKGAGTAAAGEWEDVFEIDTDKLGPASPRATCGGETTLEGFLVIKTSANFKQSAAACGPLSFTAAPPPGDVILGTNYFNGVEWQPGVEFDICTQGAVPFKITFDNDDDIATGWQDLCDIGVLGNVTRLGFAANALKDHNTALKDGYTKIQDFVQGTPALQRSQLELAIGNAARRAANQSINVMTTTVSAAINTLVANLQTALNLLVDQLAENCDCTVNKPEIPPVRINTPTVFLDYPVLTLDLEPELQEISEGFNEIRTLEESFAGSTTLTVTYKDPCSPTTQKQKFCIIPPAP